jgi:serine/threonine protein kinase
MKVSSSANSIMFLKDFAPEYIDLLQKMLIFNPKKRITKKLLLNNIEGSSMDKHQTIPKKQSQKLYHPHSVQDQFLQNISH